MGIILIGGFVLIPIAIIVTIILLISKNSHENFEQKFRTIYLYIILLISLIMIIYGSISLIVSLTNWFFPTSTSINSNSRIYKNEFINSIIGSAGIIITSIPLFGFHKRKIEKNK